MLLLLEFDRDRPESLLLLVLYLILLGLFLNNTEFDLAMDKFIRDPSDAFLLINRVGIFVSC